jgi:quercetin dioxygenase-like cupin family protein/DNA-binding Xre family transcriptional regulator
MSQDKNKDRYEDLGSAVDDYSGYDDEGRDYLTDPGAERIAAEKSEREATAVSHTNLKEARQSKGFSLEELSDRTGISAESLRQVELGEDFLPLGQLIKLSKALSVRMEDVIAKGSRSFTIVRATERRSTQRFGKSKEDSHGYEYEFLAPGKKNRKMEPFIVTLKPASGDQPSSHDGQEFIYVMEGEMELFVEDTHEVLKPGDAVYYDSSSTHLVRAHGDKPAKILAVLVD